MLNLTIHEDYTIPFFLRDKTVEMLTQMEKDGVIERVHHPKCASPIWPIKKPDGGVRIVVDFSRSINSHLLVDHYPLPRTDDLLVFLSGSKFKRLVYGLASAAPLFQSAMDIILKDLRNVKAYIDNIIIKAESKEELLKLVYKVLQILQKHNVRVNFKKCQWFKTEVKYLGHIVDKIGVHTLPSKISAIFEAPAPNDVTELRAFLGVVRYYSRFVPRLSEILEPLDKRLGKVAWSWVKEAQMAFDS
ncbi:Retrovirus-related Pol polyprotein from transposon opus [Frankliniella fusca]|uniref:Retrovirus-related Pol polyprotein from transposon opus n=1 Tax=Frankliniella fusca TaxID=407009 RepID=A0AAE1I1X3_9NEOP|nr:Retrovirus-related Pol polyprotein from transposon opus [Frankliniella fusca]